MQTLLRVAVLVAAVAATQPIVRGHHSISAVFDEQKRVTVTGTLTKVDWINPHIAITVDADRDGTSETWRFQSSPPAWWRNVGIARADFAKGIGQKVTIEAVPAHDGSRYGYMRKITFANGETLETKSNL